MWAYLSSTTAYNSSFYFLLYFFYILAHVNTTHISLVSYKNFSLFFTSMQISFSFSLSSLESSIQNLTLKYVSLTHFTYSVAIYQFRHKKDIYLSINNVFQSIFFNSFYDTIIYQVYTIRCLHARYLASLFRLRFSYKERYPATISYCRNVYLLHGTFFKSNSFIFSALLTLYHLYSSLRVYKFKFN